MLKFKITKHGMAKYSSSALSVDPQVPLLFHSLKKLLAVINQTSIISKTQTIFNAISILSHHCYRCGAKFDPQRLDDV
jgi:hypothetical protein